MIEVTRKHQNQKVFINPFHILSVMKIEGGTEIEFINSTHFIVLESPEYVATLIRDWAKHH